TIYLDLSINDLPEVIITVEKESVYLGYHDKTNLGFSESGSINQMATLINQGQIKGLVKTVYVHMKHQHKDGLYIINLFSIADDKRPGELLYSQDYISSNSKNLIEVDISDAAIVLPANGIFVG